MKLIENCNLLTAEEASALVQRDGVLKTEGLNSSPESAILDDEISNADAQKDTQLHLNTNSQTKVIELSSEIENSPDNISSVQFGK